MMRVTSDRNAAPNGLALCRIHHAAFDANILGVDADRKVHKRMQPKRDYLEERFERFRVA